MEAKEMLDKISTAIERVVKTMGEPAPKKMELGDFVAYAFKQFEQAGEDEPNEAVLRLAALKRSVEKAMAAIEKAGGGENIHIEVETAWVPDRAQGAKPMDLTTEQDQSVTEIPVQSLASRSTQKSLAKLAKEIESLRAPTKKSDPTPKEAKKDVLWPNDMNTTEFRENIDKAQTPSIWGEDPESDAA